MDRNEFISLYGRRSGITDEQLHDKGLRALPCDCGQPGCRGWQMVTVQTAMLIERDKLRRERDALLSALKAVEWVYVKDESIYADPGDQAAECPWCGGQRDYGDHAPDCQRRVAIEMVEGE